MEVKGRLTTIKTHRSTEQTEKQNKALSVQEITKRELIREEEMKRIHSKQPGKKIIMTGVCLYLSIITLTV